VAARGVRSERVASHRHLLYNHRVIARLVLGYVLGVLAFIPHLTKAVDKDHSYKLAILMTSEIAGTLQVYYDIGAGLREADSVAVPLETERREYELPLPKGGYRLLRIDPGNQLDATRSNALPSGDQTGRPTGRFHWRSCDRSTSFR